MKNKNEIINIAILLSFLLIADISIIFDIPFYRPTLGFILLIVLPGLQITNLLQLGDIGFVKKFLYSVGISISFLMFMGFFINLLGPLMGISKPISFYPIIFSINCVIISLTCLSYYKHYLDFSLTEPLHKIENEILPLPTFFLIFILILGILSGLVIQYFLWSLLSVILIIVICIGVTLIAYEKIIPTAYYPYTLFTISLALLLTHTLSSPYLFGSDIHAEILFQKLTEINSFWDPSLFSGNLNAMLSTVMLPTIYSITLDMDIIWIYKIIFPITLSLVPVIMYNIFNRQIGNKFAFLSVFFFMSFYAYFVTLLLLPRQQIAELFLALFLLTLLDKQLDNFKKSFLLFAWIASLVVSHYATTYILLILLVGVYLLMKIFSVRNSSLKLSIVIFTGIMTLSWYIYISLASAFNSIVSMGNKISTAVMNEAFSANSIDPSVNSAIGAGILGLPFLHALGHLWQIGTQFLILLGIIYIIFTYKSVKFDDEFIFLSIFGLLFLIVSMIIPFFASSLNMDRIYHIVLILISPMLIFGVLALTIISAKIFKLDMLKSPRVVSSLMVLLLVPYFLFNAGAIYEITEKSDNFKLDMSHTVANSVFSQNSSYYIISPIPIEDVVASKWISINSEPDSKIYPDTNRAGELWGYGLIDLKRVDQNGDFPQNGGYVFIGFYNYINNGFTRTNRNRVNSNIIVPMDMILAELKYRNVVYNNGAEIYY
jgi:uncharacterized membrane protein